MRLIQSSCTPPDLPEIEYYGYYSLKTDYTSYAVSHEFDVHITNGKVLFRAHKAIVSQLSSHCKSIFEGDLSCREISMNDVSDSSLELLEKMIYQPSECRTSLVNMSNLDEDLLLLCKKYDFQFLGRLLEDFFIGLKHGSVDTTQRVHDFLMKVIDYDIGSVQETIESHLHSVIFRPGNNESKVHQYDPELVSYLFEKKKWCRVCVLGELFNLILGREEIQNLRLVGTEMMRHGLRLISKTKGWMELEEPKDLQKGILFMVSLLANMISDIEEGIHIPDQCVGTHDQFEQMKLSREKGEGSASIIDELEVKASEVNDEAEEAIERLEDYWGSDLNPDMLDLVDTVKEYNRMVMYVLKNVYFTAAKQNVLGIRGLKRKRSKDFGGKRVKRIKKR